MPAIAYVIDLFSDKIDLRERIFSGDHIAIQLGVGLAVGLAAGFIAYQIGSMPFMQKATSKYNDLISNMNLNRSEMIFISMCAGVGEEILFRGAIQPFWGIIFTSIFFIAIHGYLNPKDWRISVYGIFMTGVICLLGYLTESMGLWTAIMAHAIIDLFLLSQLEKSRKEKESEPLA